MTQNNITSDRTNNIGCIAGLNNIPIDWGLTPLKDKKPYRNNWQKEAPISRDIISSDLKHNKATGYGLRTGEISDGIVAVDIDGTSVNPLLERISKGDLPDTISFTSGKKGRSQMLFKVPDNLRSQVSNFTRKSIKEFEGYCCDEGEQLEIRYNKCQSVLPPSKHPDTDVYIWINSPQDTEIAETPQWLIDLMLPTTQESSSCNDRYQKPKNKNSWETYVDKFRYSNNPIPLETPLPPHFRELIKQGTGEGNRNDSAFKLLCQLFGTANHLDSVGQAYSGTVEDLYQEFCDNCSPPLEASEATATFNSAISSDRKSSLDDFKIKNCVAGYFWRQEKSKSKGKETSDKNADVEKAIALAREVIQKGSSEILRNIQLEEIRVTYTEYSNYFWDRNVIAPLKRESNKFRFKEDLKICLQIEDRVEQIQKIQELAITYQTPAATIRLALDAMRGNTVTQEPKAHSLKELYEMESIEFQWLIPGFLPKGETVILGGNPKAGKTLLALDIAFAIVTGEVEALGQLVEGRQKVLLISADESLISTKRKLIKRGFVLEDSDYIQIVPNWNINQISTLEKYLEDFRPDLVIIDSLKKIYQNSNINENSSEFSDGIYTLKEIITRYGASSILIHHTNKDRDALGVNQFRGSSSALGAVWGGITLEHKLKPDPNNKKKLIIDPSDPRRILTTYSRDVEGKRLELEFNPEQNSFDLLGEVGCSEEVKRERITVKKQVLDLLKQYPDGLEARQIISLLSEVKKGTIYQTLNRLEESKEISTRQSKHNKRFQEYFIKSIQDTTDNAKNASIFVSNKTAITKRETQQTENIKQENNSPQNVIEKRSSLPKNNIELNQMKVKQDEEISRLLSNDGVDLWKTI